MLSWFQRILFVLGFVILGYVGAAWYYARTQQEAGNRELDRMLLDRAPFRTPETATKEQIPEGGLVGKVEIPKLHLSAVVFQGTNDQVLDRGVGHMDSSALPGQPGNVVLAAHRDTFFRSLRNIGKGDEVTVTTEDGPKNYVVESTEIVPPTDIAVAAPTPQPTLTLITCYPFYYIGHAPKRFIVRAREMENSAEIKPAPVTPAAAKSPARKHPPELSRYFLKPTPYKDALEAENSADLTYTFRVDR
jgi:LPXTG-site transpeptidase (sortase) family protein